MSPLLFDSWSRKPKIRSSFTMPALRDDSERTSRLQQEKQMLMEEVKAQKVNDDCDPVVEQILRLLYCSIITTVLCSELMKNRKIDADYK